MRFNTTTTCIIYSLMLTVLAGCNNAEDVANETGLPSIEINPQHVNVLPGSIDGSQTADIEVVVEVSFSGEDEKVDTFVEDAQPVSDEQVEGFVIAGAGIKGPLAFANVGLYALDTDASEYYDAQAPLATGSSDAFARIAGLEVSGDIDFPLVMVVDGQNAIDLNTNAAPVVNKLVTLITQDMLISRRPIYATPLTTMVFYMAQLQAGVAATAIEVEDAMLVAARQVSSTVGFGMSSEVDILTTPPIINEFTSTPSEQQLAAEHRAAIEALSALLYELSSPVGDGLLGEYFKGMGLQNLALTRVDPNIDFDWGIGIPDPGLPIDSFSVRWSGFVKPEFSEIYTFYTGSDDGVRLWVDGLLLIDNWTDHPITEDSATIVLQAGQNYSIKMEFYENWGDAVAQLDWSSDSVSRQAIPQERLFTFDLASELDTDFLLKSLARDLQSDGLIDNADNGSLIGGINVTVLKQDPNNLLVPNTSVSVANIADILEADLGFTNTESIFYRDDIVLSLSALVPDMDVDSDGILNADDLVDDSLVPPSLRFSNNVIDFGNQELGVGISFPLTLFNIGSSALPIADIAISGDFTETNNCGLTLVGGASCVIEVTFTPSEYGGRGGELLVISADDASSALIELMGNGDSLALAPSGPIVINGEGDVVISGLHISNPNGHCIDIRGGSRNIIIENSEIGPCRDAGINITWSQNVTIQNNNIHDTGWMGVYSNDAHTITVDNNRMERVASGYAAHANRMDGIHGPITFTNNYVKNVIRNFDWPAAGGNCLGLAYVEEASVRLNDNTCINVLGESDPEDIFNIYWSRGLASDPIQIMRNKIQGGGPSPSGGGIIVGDGGGAYTLVDGNILVDPGQYGVAVAGGHDHTLSNNQVYGKEQSFTNVGVYVWRQNPSEYAGTQPGTCYNIHVENNEVNWRSGVSGTLNPSWNPPTGSDGDINCGSVSGWNNNIWYSNEIFQF